MLLSMLAKLYEQQHQQHQLEQHEQHQQRLAQQMYPTSADFVGIQQQQHDEQTLAAMIAAKQLLQLQQQQQPVDLSLKSSTSNSSLNNSTGTTANSPSQHMLMMQHHHQHQHHNHQQQHNHGMQLSNYGGSRHDTDEEDDEMAMMDEELDEDDTDSLDLVKRGQSVTPISGSMKMSSLDDDDCDPDNMGATFKPQPFKVIRDKDNNFSCQYCSKKYQSMGALKMHVRTHTLPCQCKICGKSFSRPWLLQGHIRTHTGEKPFKCDQCHRAFADRSNLRAHLQTHAKVKKYSCKCCLKTFSRMSLQVKHEEHCNNTISQNGQQLPSSATNLDVITPDVLTTPVTHINDTMTTTITTVDQHETCSP